MRRITIGLISHYFGDSNLGCVALSICNVLLIDEAVREMGFSPKYVVLVNEKTKQIPLSFADLDWEYRVYSSTKQTLKHPIKLLKTKIFDDCDIVFNICAGDGFTDIYGTWRTFSETYMTLLSIKKGCPTILAPQTIGPFNNFISSRVAKLTLEKCQSIFVRDHLSFELCKKMGQDKKTKEVVDVALALPYKKRKIQDGFNLGVNVSGLLYGNDANRFGLKIDYKAFVHDIVKYGIKNGFNVHLISHVNIENELGEDDFSACKKVHDLFPSTILVPRFDTPIDAKGYIAALDFFTGARMHATIGAISSGVPVVPIAYSRKVNGLYGNLKYPFYIDAKEDDINNEVALDKFIGNLLNIERMKIAILNSKEIYEVELRKYVEELKTILGTVF